MLLSLFINHSSGILTHTTSLNLKNNTTYGNNCIVKNTEVKFISKFKYLLITTNIRRKLINQFLK